MSTKNIAVDRAIALLKAAGAVYEVHHEGQVYGGLPKQELETNKLKRTPNITGPLRGKMTRHIREVLQTVQVGGTHMLDLSEDNLKHVTIEQLQAATASSAGQLWGLGSYITHRVNDNKALEVLRVA